MHVTGGTSESRVSGGALSRQCEEMSRVPAASVLSHRGVEGKGPHLTESSPCPLVHSGKKKRSGLCSRLTLNHPTTLGTHVAQALPSYGRQEVWVTCDLWGPGYSSASQLYIRGYLDAYHSLAPQEATPPGRTA